MRFLFEHLTALHARMEVLLGARALHLVRYLISGGIAATSNLVFLFLIVHFFHVHYLAASIVAFVMSIAVSFTLQKFWTFQDTLLHDVHVQFSRYLVVVLTNLTLNILLMYFFVESFGLWYLYAQLLATAIIAVVGYFGYKYFVFRGKPSTTP